MLLHLFTISGHSAIVHALLDAISKRTARPGCRDGEKGNSLTIVFPRSKHQHRIIGFGTTGKEGDCKLIFSSALNGFGKMNLSKRTRAAN